MSGASRSISTAFIAFLTCAFGFAADPGPISATIAVVDQDGRAMVGVSVLGKAKGKWELRTTDANGIAQWEFPSSSYGSFEVIPPNNGFESYPGYYAQEFTRFDFPMKNPGRETRIVNATMAVRKILDPVPMRRFFLTKTGLPPGDGPWGFDLVVADWVAPFGTGTVADMMVGIHAAPGGNRLEFERMFRQSFFNADGTEKRDPQPKITFAVTTSATFPGINNGIITIPLRASEHHWSLFRHPYVAPNDGYRTWYSKTGTADAAYGLSSEGNRPYGDLEPLSIFRIRTPATVSRIVRSSTHAVFDPKRIYSATRADPALFDGALVGKIVRGPLWIPGRNDLYFEYYINLNPNSRSLEFNRKNIDNPEQTWPEGDP